MSKESVPMTTQAQQKQVDEMFAAARQAAKARRNAKKSLPSDAPAPLPDPDGLKFTPEQLDTLIELNTEDAVALAFGTATPEAKELLSAKEDGA